MPAICVPHVCRVWGSLLRVWMVDLLVAVRVLPLQALSLVVVTLPWTLPRLLSLQLATAASVVEGGRHMGVDLPAMHATWVI